MTSVLSLLTFSHTPPRTKKCENTRRMKTPLTPRALKTFQARLLAWFRAHKRDLPWRRSRDPYRIWVAEIMLQQTRIAAVMPYFDRFLSRFPNVQTLARARNCLLYTSPSPRDSTSSRMPSSA